MRIGVVFPQTEFGSDPAAIRDFAVSAETLGYKHILAYSHILGANPQRPGGWQGPYTHQDSFQEPLMLFSHMAALTQTIEFVSGIIILPQRETALIAKQAATLDVLSGGRLRLGVGIGWNPIEYTAQNQDFHTRGKRIEEQVTVLRRLWTQPLVTFKGRWHDIQDAGLNPLPKQQPIPIWFGGYADVVLRRIAHMGDGWFPGSSQPQKVQPSLDKLWRFMDELGRDRSEVGIEPRIPYGDGDPRKWEAAIKAWRAAGATHLSLNTMRAGLQGPASHLAAIHKFARVFDAT